MSFAQLQDVAYTLLHEEMRQYGNTSAEATEILSRSLTVRPSAESATPREEVKTPVVTKTQNDQALKALTAMMRGVKK